MQLRTSYSPQIKKKWILYPKKMITEIDESYQSYRKNTYPNVSAVSNIVPLGKTTCSFLQGTIGMQALCLQKDKCRCAKLIIHCRFSYKLDFTKSLLSTIWRSSAVGRRSFQQTAPTLGQ
jgi:hypothetical protein